MLNEGKIKNYGLKIFFNVRTKLPESLSRGSKLAVVGVGGAPQAT
jgi:hypothetical protein